MMGYGAYWLFGGWSMWIGMVVWFVIIGLAIWALVSLVERRSNVPQRSALEILQERYARGEISQKEYLQARQDLG